MGEIWKDIPGYEGLYQASSMGRIRGLDRTTLTPAGLRRRLRGMVLRASPDSWGYLRVHLYRGSARYSACVHVLVCETFHGARPSGHEARHLDGKKPNCRSSNLEWSTPDKNQQDRVEHGTSNRGERCGNAKLTCRQIRSIRSKYNKGKVTQATLAAAFGVSRGHVHRIVTGKQWGWL